MSKCLTCIVHGKVQRVSFRDYTRECARTLALVGTVRNCPDETVEVIAEGEESALKAFILALKTKYPYVKITGIDEVWSDAVGSYTDFRIL